MGGRRRSRRPWTNFLRGGWSAVGGDFDLVAVGRALLQDPQWAVKVHAGRTEELMDFAPSAMATLF